MNWVNAFVSAVVTWVNYAVVTWVNWVDTYLMKEIPRMAQLMMSQLGNYWVWFEFFYSSDARIWMHFILESLWPLGVFRILRHWQRFLFPVNLPCDMLIQNICGCNGVWCKLKEGEGHIQTDKQMVNCFTYYIDAY